MSTAILSPMSSTRHVAAPLQAAARSRSRRSPVRLTRRGRLVVVLAITLIAATAMLFGRAQVVAGPTSKGPIAQYVTVQSGDTLWELAAAVAPGRDPRPVIDRIVELNGLESGALRAGQRLAVPVRG
jgi:hypothetical protein